MPCNGPKEKQKGGAPEWKVFVIVYIYGVKHVRREATNLQRGVGCV